MKKYFFFFPFFFFFVSCNLSLFISSLPKCPPEGVLSLSSTSFNPSSSVQFLRAEEASSDNGISISWSAFPDADYYIVERANIASREKITVPETAWTTLAVNPTAPEYTDINASDTSTYYAYRVKAYSRRLGKFSQYSNVSYGSLLSAPSGVSASKGKDYQYIEISFNKVPGSSGYNIYKLVDGNIDNTPVNSTPVLNQVGKDKVTYRYEPSETEKGQKVSFVVRTIGGNNEKNLSEQTNVYIGYTRLSKAPDVPGDFQASKALSTSQISISFSISEFDTTDMRWTLYRVNEGAGESERVTLYPEQAQNGVIYWIDDDRLLKENVAYTYSLVPENKYGKGEAAISVGYLFSTPIAVDLEPVNNMSRCGYILNVAPPIGVGECPQLGYRVREKYVNGTEVVKTYDTQESVFYNCARNIESEPDVYSNEIKEVEVHLIDRTSTDLISKGSVSNAVEQVPEVVTDLNATKNYYSTDIGKVNADGLFPIKITWSTSITPAKTLLYRNDGTEINVKDNDGVYYDSQTEIAKKYSYTIECLDKLGRSKGVSVLTSDSSNAYGAMDALHLAEQFEWHCLKPWEYYGHSEYRTNSSYNSIYNKVKQGSTGSLSDGITVNGRYKHSSSSTIFYSASVSGVGGKVTFRYNNFGECEYLWISGSAYYVMEVSSSGDGSITEHSTFNVAGMYSASISFGGLAIQGKSFAGAYSITMKYSNGNVNFSVPR